MFPPFPFDEFCTLPTPDNILVDPAVAAISLSADNELTIPIKFIAVFCAILTVDDKPTIVAHGLFPP